MSERRSGIGEDYQKLVVTKEYLEELSMLIVCTRDMHVFVGMQIFHFIRVQFGFLEFSRNRLAVTCDPLGDTSFIPSS